MVVGVLKITLANPKSPADQTCVNPLVNDPLYQIGMYGKNFYFKNKGIIKSPG